MDETFTPCRASTRRTSEPRDNQGERRGAGREREPPPSPESRAGKLPPHEQAAGDPREQGDRQEIDRRRPHPIPDSAQIVAAARVHAGEKTLERDTAALPRPPLA